MPKMKTVRSAAKRFRITKSGKIKRHRAFASHLLTGKSAGRRRKLRHNVLVSSHDRKAVLALLPAARKFR